MGVHLAVGAQLKIGDVRTLAWPVAQVILAASMLCAPAVMLGHPYAFLDSEHYFRVGESALHDALGVAPMGHAPPPAPDPAAGQSAQSGGAAPEPYDWKLMMRTGVLARSAFYAAPFYIMTVIGGLWGMVVVQALIVALALRQVISVLRLARPGWALLMITAGLTVFTQLGLFTSLLMPDVFGGVAILCMVLLLVYPDRLHWVQKAFWWAILVWAIAMHGSYMLTVVALLAVAFLAFRLLAVPPRSIVRRSGAIVGALIAMTALNLGYQKVLEVKLGGPPKFPPFLAARVLADGPGRDYLRSVCPQAGLALCAYRHLPLDDSDAILWSWEPEVAVFAPASARVRMQIIEEQAPFLLGVLRHDAWGQASASARNVVLQLGRFGFQETFETYTMAWVADPHYSQEAIGRLMPNRDKCRRDAAACSHPQAWRRIEVVQISAVLVALAALAVTLWRSRRDFTGALRSDLDRLYLLTALIGAGLLANALACGVLSGPFDRYQARIIWLALFVAALWLWPRSADGRSGSGTMASERATATP